MAFISLDINSLLVVIWGQTLRIVFEFPLSYPISPHLPNHKTPLSFVPVFAHWLPQCSADTVQRETFLNAPALVRSAPAVPTPRVSPSTNWQPCSPSFCERGSAYSPSLTLRSTFSQKVLSFAWLSFFSLYHAVYSFHAIDNIQIYFIVAHCQSLHTHVQIWKSEVLCWLLLNPRSPRIVSDLTQCIRSISKWMGSLPVTFLFAGFNTQQNQCKEGEFTFAWNLRI